MAEEQEHVTVGEFTRTMQTVERQLTAGFDRTSREIANVSRGLHKRLDIVDQTTDDQGREIAALQERTVSAKRTAGNSGAVTGGTVAAVLTGLYMFFQWVTGGKP